MGTKELVVELKESEKVRSKISVWLGSASNWFHVIKELIGNSQDEIMKGNGNKIDIILHNKNKIEFIDNANGLPLEGKSDKGTENWKALLMTLFAGTKYGFETAQIGTNGVFLTVLTYSSKKVLYEVGRPNGNVYAISFEQGEIKEPFRMIGKTKDTYTKIIFELDDEVYNNIDFKFEDICEVAEGQASLTNATITVRDIENNKYKEYKFDNGIVDYLKELNRNNNQISDIIEFNKDVSIYVPKFERNDDLTVRLAFQFCQEEEVVQKEFLNGSDLLYHGTPQEGIFNGFKSGFHKQIKALGLYKTNEKQVKVEDVMLGLSYICDIKSIFAEYQNQTKLASNVEYYKPTLQTMIEEQLEIYFTENKIEGEKLCQRVLVNKRSRESAENTRASVRKALQSENKSYTDIPNFINCRSKKSQERELMIVEGKSALGAIVQGRNSSNQAIYAIRGKILSCLKSTTAKIFSNDIVRNIYRILNCGVELKDKHIKDLVNFDIGKLNYDKIIIATDADLDGFSIRVLLLSMFYKVSPTLLKEGKVYVVEAPLFEIHTKNKVLYAYSEEEKDEITKGLKKYEIMRNKGLGEMESQSIHTSLMNPETRRIVQITVEDVERMAETFDLFMGTDADKRKEIIYELFDIYEEVE